MVEHVLAICNNLCYFPPGIVVPNIKHSHSSRSILHRLKGLQFSSDGTMHRFNKSLKRHDVSARLGISLESCRGRGSY